MSCEITIAESDLLISNGENGTSSTDTAPLTGVELCNFGRLLVQVLRRHACLVSPFGPSLVKLCTYFITSLVYPCHILICSAEVVLSSRRMSLVNDAL